MQAIHTAATVAVVGVGPGANSVVAVGGGTSTVSALPATTVIRGRPVNWGLWGGLTGGPGSLEPPLRGS